MRIPVRLVVLCLFSMALIMCLTACSGFVSTPTPVYTPLPKVTMNYAAADTFNNQVVGFTIGAVNGTLTPLTTGFPVQLATTPTPGAGPVPVTIDPAGHFLYVGNTFNDTISIYTVDLTSGQLTQNTTSPLTFTGSGPNAIVIH